jgi:cytoskeletal protein CcmA (bactofilin family)
MFAKKPEELKPATADAGAAATAARPASKEAAPTMPPRKPVIRPEVVRSSRDYSMSGSGREREEVNYRGYGEGKKLIVGRDIALSGQISSCEKLVVEGRVEANIAECREIEISETGTFKGEAEIDVAEIGGTFEGTLLARDLLMIRANGRVTGKVRYGRIEVERGGQINGDVRVYGSDGADDANARKPATHGE